MLLIDAWDAFQIVPDRCAGTPGGLGMAERARFVYGRGVGSHRLSILHVSDLHVRADEGQLGWRRRRVLGTRWEENLDDLLQDGPLDMVCFTGDLAHAGKPEEYALLTPFIDELLSRVKVPRERCFVVPGNHDIDRSIGETAWRELRKMAWNESEALSRWMAGGHPPPRVTEAWREEVLLRQAAYRAWVRDALKRPELLPGAAGKHPRLGWHVALDGVPVPVHVIGLDSAWLAGDHADARKLRLTEDQVGILTERLEGLRIVLVHHPLSDLADESSCRRLLAERADLLLRGHLHDAELSLWEDPDRNLRELAAGCLYESDEYRNGCQRVDLTLDDGGRIVGVDVHFRAWSPRGHWHADSGVYAAAKGGRYAWRVSSAAPRVAVPAGSSPPSTLPPRRLFVGRSEELDHLDRVLKSGKFATVVPGVQAALFGLGGVGKTALALEYAHRHLPEYRGGAWWVHAEGNPIDAMAVLAADLRRVGAQAVREAIAHEPVDATALQLARAAMLALQNNPDPSLLVLDNADAAGWQDHIPGGAVKVLMTTRDKRLAVGEPTLLQVLPTNDAGALAVAIAGQPGAGAEAEALGRVMQEFDGLAVAVEVSARAVKEWRHSWVDYERDLRARMSETLEDPDAYSRQYNRGVFAALDLSIGRCPPGTTERQILDGMVVFAASDVPLEWIASVVNQDVGSSATTKAVAALAALGLVSANRDGGLLSMHRLVRFRVRQQNEKSDEAGVAERVRRASACVTAWLMNTVDATRMQEVDAHRSHIDAVLQDGDRLRLDNYWTLMVTAYVNHLNYRAQHEEARSLLEVALDKAERLSPPMPPLVSACLSNLARAMNGLGKTREAEALMARAVEVNKSMVAARVGVSENFGLPDLVRQAEVLHAAGKLEEARGLLERALPLYESEYGKDHPRVARVLSTMGIVLNELGGGAEALVLLERAVAIAESTHGLAHPDGITDLSNLAIVLRDLGHVDDACRILELALPATEQVFGPRHPKVAVALVNLGTVLQDLGRAEEALPLLRRALDIERAQNPGHSRVANALSGVASILLELGKFAEARSLLEEAVKIDEANFGSEHQTVALRTANLGMVLKAEGDLPGALRHLRRAAEIDERIRGPWHPAVASDLGNLGAILHEAGRDAEALPILERALDITRHNWGEDHPAMANPLCNLGMVVGSLGRGADAISLLRRATAIDEKNPDSVRPQDAIVRLTTLAALLRAAHQRAEGVSLLEKAKTLAEARLGVSHPAVAECLVAMAILRLDDGARREARELAEHALAVARKSVADNHPLMEKIRQVLAAARRS